VNWRSVRWRAPRIGGPAGRPAITVIAPSRRADDVDEPADRPGADHIGLVHDEEQPRAAPGEPPAEGVGVVGEPLDEGRDQDGDGLVERRVANGGVQAVRPSRSSSWSGRTGSAPRGRPRERDGDRVEACGSQLRQEAAPVADSQLIEQGERDVAEHVEGVARMVASAPAPARSVRSVRKTAC